MERMKQLGLSLSLSLSLYIYIYIYIYKYTWKCHNETSCIDILKKNVLFFKNGKQEGNTVPIWELVPGRCLGIRKGIGA
jgi:hypothetical protein